MIDIFRSPPAQQPLHPQTDKGASRLRESARASYKKLEPFRMVNKALIDMYTGGSYGDGGDSGSQPLNLLELGISIYQRKLASHTPQVLVTSRNLGLKATAVELELALNHIIAHQLDLGTRLNEWVINALFGVGIMKVGRVSPREPRPLGYNSAGVNIYAEVVGLEDWVHDVTAKHLEDVDFCGHMFTLTLEEVLDNDEFSQAAKEAAYAAVRSNDMRGFGMGSSSERPETISGDGSWSQDALIQKVDLWEYFLPRTNEIVVTLEDHDVEPLYVGPHEGPDHGPYTMMGYSPVPGNIMPLSPAQLWEDLISLVNSLFLKAGDQADRSRTILAAQNRNAGDLDKVIHTADGETVLTDFDPNMIREFKFGGADPGVMGAIMQFKDFFSYQAGNLDALGGLGPMSETIGQDKMMSATASERLADMQQRTIKGSVQVIRDIAWHLWHEESIDLELTKTLTPTISRDFRWNQYSREGDILDFNFDIVPYSLQSKSPQERLQTINMVVQQVILPVMPMLQQAGLTFDLKKYLETVAKLSNVEELNELVRDATGQQLNQRTEMQPSSSPVSQRNYTRQNMPSPDKQGQDAMQLLQQQNQPSMQNMMPGRGRPPAAATR